jgi:uncharacterized protein YlxW (UPF0749 family)
MPPREKPDVAALAAAWAEEREKVERIAEQVRAAEHELNSAQCRLSNAKTDEGQAWAALEAARAEMGARRG